MTVPDPSHPDPEFERRVAARTAELTEMLAWLMSDYGYDLASASHLMGQTVGYDIGNVYNGFDDFDAGTLRVSTGAAVLWRSPMGPISISYAFPLRKEDGDDIERLQFTFGGSF